MFYYFLFLYAKYIQLVNLEIFYMHLTRIMVEVLAKIGMELLDFISCQNFAPTNVGDPLKPKHIHLSPEF